LKTFAYEIIILRPDPRPLTRSFSNDRFVWVKRYSQTKANILRTMSQGDILTEATEGICWHKNNFTKSKEDGINECNIPEFLKVTLKRASNNTQHRGLYSSTSSETLNEGTHRRNWRRKENFEGKSMHASVGADYIDVIDFGDGLTQKMRTMSACSEDAVSVNVGLMADSTNSISDYGEGARQKMESGSMKDLDGTANFSVEIGEGKEGIDHTLDFGEGTTEKSEPGHLKSAAKGKEVSISNDDAEDLAMDIALRSSSWMTREQLESFVRVALRSKENRITPSVEANDAHFVEAVVTASVQAVAASSATKTRESAALEQLVGSMNAKMKRVFVEKATSTMSKEQMRNFVIEAYDARERGSVKAAIESMTAQQIQKTLREMTATMDAAEKRDFAAESVTSLDREALEKIFDRAAKSMTKEEFQNSLTRLEEEAEENVRRKGEYAEKGESEKLEKETFLGGIAKMEKAERNMAVKKRSETAEARRAEETFRSEAFSAKNATVAAREEKESTSKAEMRRIEEKQKLFLQRSDEFKNECRIFQEQTSAFKQQVSSYKEESSSFKKSVASFIAETSTYKESEEILRRQLSAASCERADCVEERKEMAIRIRELTAELAEAKMNRMEAKALKVVAVGEQTVRKMEETIMTETKIREETKELEKIYREVEKKESRAQKRGSSEATAEMGSDGVKTVEERSAAMLEKQASTETYVRCSKESLERARSASSSLSSSKAIAQSESRGQMEAISEMEACSNEEGRMTAEMKSNAMVRNHAKHFANSITDEASERINVAESEYIMEEQTHAQSSSSSETRAMRQEHIGSTVISQMEALDGQSLQVEESCSATKMAIQSENQTAIGYESQREMQTQSVAFKSNSESQTRIDSEARTQEGECSSASKKGQQYIERLETAELVESSARELNEARSRNVSEGEMLSYNSRVVAAEADGQSGATRIVAAESEQCGTTRASYETQTAAAATQQTECNRSFGEESTLRERTLSWKRHNDRSFGGRKESRLGADEGESDGISWHHINYKSADEEKNQPEFLKAKLKKTSFGPNDRERRRKSSGSDASSQ